MHRQLPAYSPVSLSGIARATLDALRSPDAAREALREHLMRRFDAERVCLTGSGTEALRLALEIAERTRGTSGGHVALPAYSCYDVVTAAVGAEVRASFYDIDPVSLSPDMESLERALSEGATTVVVGNLFAFPIDWTAVRALCDRAGVLLVEDAAQGLGSGWAGRDFGTFGDLTVLSFGRGKGWTGGGGGALLARGAAVVAGLDGPGGSLPRPRTGAGARAAALSFAQWAIGRPQLYGLATALPGTGLGETHYKEPVPAAGIPAFCAAMALETADGARAAVGTRREWAGRWDAALRDLSGTGSPAPRTPLGGGTCGWLRYPLLAADEARAEAFLARAASAGAARGYPRALPDLAQAEAIRDGQPGDTPGARALAAGLVTLPTHRWVGERELNAAADW